MYSFDDLRNTLWITMHTCIHMHAHLHMDICTCTSAYGHPQTMNGLKTLLTEEGVNFTDATFNTEDGIRGLGEQPFVSNMSTC